MHPAIIIGTVRSLWTWLWSRYHVPQNVFLYSIVDNSLMIGGILLLITNRKSHMKGPTEKWTTFPLDPSYLSGLSPLLVQCVFWLQWKNGLSRLPKMLLIYVVRKSRFLCGSVSVFVTLFCLLLLRYLEVLE